MCLARVGWCFVDGRDVLLRAGRCTRAGGDARQVAMVQLTDTVLTSGMNFILDVKVGMQSPLEAS